MHDYFHLVEYNSIHKVIHTSRLEINKNKQMTTKYLNMYHRQSEQTNNDNIYKRVQSVQIVFVAQSSTIIKSNQGEYIELTEL